MQEAEKEEQSINTSCNLTTFGCLRSFKVEISLFICDIITVDQSQSLDSKSMIFKKQNTNLSPERFIKDNQLKPRSIRSFFILFSDRNPFQDYKKYA